jgi:hypothetical protein
MRIVTVHGVERLPRFTSPANDNPRPQTIAERRRSIVRLGLFLAALAFGPGLGRAVGLW